MDVFNTSITTNDLIFGFIACLAAIWIGRTLAKKQAHAYKAQRDSGTEAQQPGSGGLPTVNHIDFGDMRFLHLGTPWVQGSMKISKPNDIHLE